MLCLILKTKLVACLTTLSSLSWLFAGFLCKGIAKSKTSWQIAIGIMVVISFLLSLTGLAAISKVLGSILQYIFYPALIVLAITSILCKYIWFKSIQQLFWASITAALIYRLLG